MFNKCFIILQVGNCFSMHTKSLHIKTKQIWQRMNDNFLVLKLGVQTSTLQGFNKPQLFQRQTQNPRRKYYNLSNLLWAEHFFLSHKQYLYNCLNGISLKLYIMGFIVLTLDLGLFVYSSSVVFSQNLVKRVVSLERVLGH